MKRVFPRGDSADGRKISPPRQMGLYASREGQGAIIENRKELKGCLLEAEGGRNNLNCCKGLEVIPNNWEGVLVS